MVSNFAGKEMSVAILERGQLAKQLKQAEKKWKFWHIDSSLIEMDGIKTPKVLVVMTEDRMQPFVTLHPATAETVNYMATLDEAQSDQALQKWLHNQANKLPKSAPNTVVELESNPWEAGPLMQMLDVKPDHDPSKSIGKPKSKSRLRSR